MEHKIKTKFYTYNQNNSGGDFVYCKEKRILEYVIVEAINVEHANTRAKDIGIYFNGCETGDDCYCCGDRWSKVYENDGYDVPSIYGNPLNDSNHEKYSFVHYLDIKY